MKRFYLKSFGCKVNQYDAQVLRERLLGSGLSETLSPVKADLVIVNFCVITARAASRSRRVLKSLAGKKPGARIIAAGCVPSQERERVLEAVPDVILPGREEQKGLAQGLIPVPAGKNGFCRVDGLEAHTRAFLKVQDGCNMRCAFCIIPSIRGIECSRPPDDVSAEAGRLLDNGYKEIVFCGIRLGGYKSGKLRLDGLLRKVLDDHQRDFRVRLSSLNPAEATPALLEVMGNDPRAARHLHLPLQSGDAGILKAMRRPYTPDQFLSKAEEVHAALEDPAISTDLMVGFPGEDERAFEASLTLLEKAGVSRVHVFPYSKRDGTEAAALPAVHDRDKKYRVEKAAETAKRLKKAYDTGFVGKKARVLIESEEKRATDRFKGLTSRYQQVILCGRPGCGINSFVVARLDKYEDGVFNEKTG